MNEYEYKTVQISPGADRVWVVDLNSLGEKGYRLVAVVPLIDIRYIGNSIQNVDNGSDLIFERRKE